MIQDSIICSNCDKTFNLKRCEHIYRCGDTYVCSYNCSRERYYELRNLDPGLVRPHTWPLAKSTSATSLFDSDAMSEDNLIPIIIENAGREKECQINFNEMTHDRSAQMCRQCFIIGLPSLCAICILVSISL